MKQLLNEAQLFVVERMSDFTS